MHWLILLIIFLSAPLYADDAAAVQKGRRFLLGLVNPELHLLPEFPGHRVCWLYHDNWLAAKVLAPEHPEEAAQIMAAIRGFGVERSGKIELLFGEGTLPLRRYELRDVTQRGGFTIRSEFTTPEENRDFAGYADLLCFAAIAEPDAVKARAHMDSALALWDGTGFADAAMKHAGLYATYKLALALRAAQRFGMDSPVLTAARARLLKMQAESGGWITDYKPDGTPDGKANVETTSLASLALEAPAWLRREESVRYGEYAGSALTMDVFHPVRQRNGAGVILLASGGWASSRGMINEKYAAHFLARGYTVFAVVHASCPPVSIPQIIPGVHRAVRFVRHQAADYGVAPDRLGITGASSGGHLSLIVATQGGPGDPQAADPVDRESSAVQAAACFFPPTDFLNYVKPGLNAMDESVLKNFRKFIGDIPADVAERDALGRRISPLYSVSASTPPCLLIHGEKDQHVLLHQSQSFVTALKKAGGTAQINIKAGKPHGWPDMGSDVEACADWFDAHLKPPAPASAR